MEAHSKGILMIFLVSILLSTAQPSLPPQGWQPPNAECHVLGNNWYCLVPSNSCTMDQPGAVVHYFCKEGTYTITDCFTSIKRPSIPTDGIYCNTNQYWIDPYAPVQAEEHLPPMEGWVYVAIGGFILCFVFYLKKHKYPSLTDPKPKPRVDIKK